MKGHDVTRRDVLLEIVVANRLAEVAVFIGEEKTLVCIEVPAIASDARIDRIEQRLWLSQEADGRVLHSPPA
jgi:hypothetical protein